MQGVAKIKLAIEAIQAALPMLPMGSEIHADAMKAVSSLSKHLAKDVGGGDGAGIQQLLEMIRNAKTQGAPPQAGMMPPGGGAPPPPAPPPMGAPPPGMM